MDEPRLVPFEPPIPPSTNGNGHRGGRRRQRRRALGGISFGVLLGALLATSLVPRLQWLNLSRLGWWGRPVACAVAAGLLVGWYRRDDLRGALWTGGIAGVLSLWVVYAMVRASVPVLFVERSFARVAAIDLARLAIYGAAGGVVGAGVVWRLRARMLRRSGRIPADTR